ncbi:hypothetical protein HPB49_005928 [Dermacentor silvarum]|uniref:Uncharacterized protein n=1 Tax=Dermacentor silvarum TaxID=543639 RepID=A0ACB8DW04_DERSI|nr:hypothetical protein HPB49_005928 [Dermacentor silvarum]
MPKPYGALNHLRNPLRPRRPGQGEQSRLHVDDASVELKPSTRPTLDTKKSISELFPSRPIIKPILRPLSPTAVHSQFPDVNCALRHVINFEESCAIEAPDAVVAVAAKQVDESHSDLVKNIFNNVRQLHHNFEVSTTLPLRLTKCDMLSTLSGKKKCFYQSVVGLFIHPEQPWLCCSPDGILDSDGRMYLVEIKCPFSLKDKKLIDHEHEESFVPYIHYQTILILIWALEALDRMLIDFIEGILRMMP